MSSSPSGRNPKPPLQALVDPSLMKALSHVLRQHILLATLQSPISPKEMSDLFGENLATVSYHTKILNQDCGELVELERTESRRGAIQHFYRASTKTLLQARSWRNIKGRIRTVIGSGMASDLFDDLAAAVAAGKLEGKESYIFRTPLILDAAGARAIKEIAERAAREVEEQQQESAARIGKDAADGKVGSFSFGVMSFESAEASPGSHPLAGRASR